MSKDDILPDKNSSEMILKELKNESPRAVAIIVCAYFDSILNEFIKLKVKDRNIIKNFIERLTFERRVMMANILGIITTHERNALKIISKIRNRFAHDIRYNDFNMDKIPQECDALVHTMKVFFDDKYKEQKRKAKEIGEKLGRNIDVPPVEHPIFKSDDSPQKKFVFSVGQYMGYMNAKLGGYKLIDKASDMSEEAKKKFLKEI